MITISENVKAKWQTLKSSVKDFAKTLVNTNINIDTKE